MRFENKGARTAYAILCVVLSLALIVGIFLVVQLGKAYDGGEKLKPSISNRIESKPENNSNDNGGIDWDSESSETEINGDMDKYILPANENSYDIDIPYGNVTILPTDGDEPYIEYHSDLNIEVRLHDDDGKSEIDVKMPDRLSEILDVPPAFWSSGEADKFLVNFYLPSDLDELTFDINAGQVKVNDMKIRDFDIDVRAANMIIKDCVFDEADVDISAGNLQYYADGNVRKIDIDVKVGNAELFLPKDIAGFELNYNIKLGNFSNKTAFDTYSSAKEFISQSGIIKYENNACKIKLDMTTGNVNLRDY